MQIISIIEPHQFIELGRANSHGVFINNGEAILIPTNWSMLTSFMTILMWVQRKLGHYIVMKQIEHKSEKALPSLKLVGMFRRPAILKTSIALRIGV